MNDTTKSSEEPYVPELGQAVFGCPTGEYACPEYIEAFLRHIASEIERVEWNRTQKKYEAPTANNGGKWSNGTFSMRAYYWGDDKDEASVPNFQYGDIEIRWYKYLGRGMTINRPVTELEARMMLDKCLASIRAAEKEPWEAATDNHQ